MNIMSLTYCAEKFTWMRKPNPDELPHIGTAQDIAWAAWNRAGAASVSDIKYLLVTQVMNAGSREVFRSALETLVPSQSEYRLWPGHEFAMDTAGGQAILGMLCIRKCLSNWYSPRVRLTSRTLGWILPPTTQRKARWQSIHLQS
jgi:hypothetical protein